MKPSKLSIKALQLSAVERLLQCVQNQTQPVNAVQNEWKVLVYDDFCRDLISPLLTVRKLRENGVTLHMSLANKTRDPIPDVPAVYLVQPTEENILMVIEDCKKKLYDELYLNFCRPLSEDLMKLLAKGMVEVNSVNMVAKVYDQFLGFVSLEPDLFTLNMKDSFVRYNNPKLGDGDVEKFIKDIAEAATSAVATLGVLPIIRSTKGGPAEMVARQVCETVRSLYMDNKAGHIFASGGSSLEQRPIMLILDRSVDMAATLYHTSGYQTLVDDLLEFRLNRVTIQTNAEDGKKAATKVFSLNSEQDQFWDTYAGKMIPEAVEAHSTELLAVSNQVERIKAETGGDDINEESSKTSSLLNTVQSLPALLEKKKALEMHLEVIKSTMSIISDRHVYKFAEVEEGIVYNLYGDQVKITELLQDPSYVLEDKVRCLAVFLLGTNPDAQVTNQLVALVEEQVGDSAEAKQLFNTIQYIKRMLSLTGFGSKAQSPAQDSASTLWSFADRAAQSLMKAQQQVKGLVGGAKLLTATRMFDAVCKDATSATVAAEVDSEFLYLDPKVADGHVAQSARIRTPFTRGVLFMVGGGCFAEYHNLKEYASKELSSSKTLGLGSSGAQVKKQLIYGCTELVNARQFMAQIASCYS